MQNVFDLEQNLSNFYGTISYHRHSKNLLLTDGALYLAENAECFWLFDIVDSVLSFGSIRNESFLNVRFLRDDKGEADVLIDDGNDNVLYKQHIEFSDFPFNDYSFFVQKTHNGKNDIFVALLLSEY